MTAVRPPQARRDALLEMTRAADGALSLLAPSQLYHLAQSKHPPLYALGRVHECIEACLEQARPRSLTAARLGCLMQWCKTPPQNGARRLHSPSASTLLLSQRARRSWALEQLCYRQFEALAVALTGCERILRTPLPPGYVGVLR